ncbi:MAG: zinc transporter ZupT [Oscillospiraceae bacterium]|nr:MAG: zinc transporter ZupT [Oscillospiraceae bacterium]
MEQQVGTALLLSTAAGMATLVGAGIALIRRRPAARMMALSLGLAAGVMAAVSLLELLPDGLAALAIGMPGPAGLLAVGAACGVGVLSAMLLKLAIPETAGQAAYSRLGLFAAAALLAHNLPEGMAVFLGGSADPGAGVRLCLAIALHNIPEGISVAMPVMGAGESRARALGLAAAAGFAEPAGAVLAWLFLDGRLGENGLPLICCGVAGLMVALALLELMPAAWRARRLPAALGFLLGTAVAMGALALEIGQ